MNCLEIQNVNSVLCLGAHADDIEIGCGGTLMKVLASNPQVRFHWVVFSARGQRKQEALNSVQTLTCLDNMTVETHEFDDSFFPAQWKQLKEVFFELQSSVDPDLVFTHRREDRHQDHSTISELTWNTFRDHLILEYEIPKFEGDLGHPNVFVPLDHELSERKCDWITSSFPTQSKKHWFDGETLRSLLRLRGIESGQEARYAEAFYCRKLSLRI